MELGDRVHVVAGVLRSDRGEVLVAQRHANSHLGGLWEFPGGKAEDTEDALTALTRELQEELGITVRSARPLIRVWHDYPDRRVLLDVWQVDSWHGEPVGHEGQAIAWLLPERAQAHHFPAADVPVIAAIRLPPVYLITPEPGADVEAFLSRLDGCLDAGVRLVQLRAKSFDSESYRELAARALDVCRRRGAELLLNADPALVPAVGASGVHLTTQRLMSLQSRPLAAGYWVGASCHDPLELAHACEIGVDFAVLGPVKPTASHPGVRTLGWARFGTWTERATIPVYALGGLSEADLPAAWAHGGQGIASISAVWGAP